MPKKSQHSVEEQHSCLSKALASKTVLIVMDDCWDKQHAKCFDVIDTASVSMYGLFLTRIKIYASHEISVGQTCEFL